ncbi:hypothetical protein A3F37_01690 [Candidatus Saccharibacteria bacterium RIFCSPHIGHO2_12_FULL_41_12]|nr:MAG: hypothetical protein A3F37_01690 [Candidatus Saccharibacteria bacterium RIFCSPHIGHO2_12_FULL_41_12]
MNTGLIDQVLIFANNFSRISDQVLRERLGFTYAKFLVLQQIYQGNNISHMISKNLGKTEASVSRQIAILEKELLIKRKINNSDDRQKIIYLTKKGTLVLKNCHKAINAYFDSKTSDINCKDKTVNELISINKEIANL